MVDELLRGFGLRTGRFTSPHLSDITERIVVDGEQITPQRFVEAYDEIAPYIELVDSKHEIKLSFFEVMVGLAYALFADAPIDVAVVEVGLGGEWDATNTIDGEVAVVTPIDLDHMNFLGTTVERDRHREGRDHQAGRDRGPRRAGPRRPRAAAAPGHRGRGRRSPARARSSASPSAASPSAARSSPIQGLGGMYEEVFLPLHGAHQAENAACALAAVEAFFGAGAATGPLDPDIVRAAFAAVRSPGRLEAVRSAPTILIDAAHNPHGMRASVQALSEAFDFRRLVAVVAMLGDKDAHGVLTPLETIADEVVVTQNSSSRAVPADELARQAVDVFGAERVTVEPRLDDAIETAVRLAEENSDDVLSGAGVLVTGSVVTAGEARLLLRPRD